LIASAIPGARIRFLRRCRVHLAQRVLSPIVTATCSLTLAA